MDLDIKTIAQFVSAGGVLAYATLVYLQLRGFLAELQLHRAEAMAMRDEVTKVSQAVTHLLERDRDRKVREMIREEISGVHEVSDSEPVDPTPIPHRRSAPFGYPAVTYGPTAPKKGKP